MTEGVREGAGAAAPEELTGQYNKSSHAAILFIKAAWAMRFMSGSNINGFPRRAGKFLLLWVSLFFPFGNLGCWQYEDACSGKMLCFMVKFKFLINSQSAETDIPDIQFYDSESVRGGEKSRSFWLKRQSVLKFRELQKPGRENFPNLGRHCNVESFLVVLNSVKEKTFKE